MQTPQLVIECDALSLAKAQMKIEIWENYKSGKYIATNESGTTPYDPDERIGYWTTQRDKYLKRVEGYIPIPELPAILLTIWTAISPAVLTILKGLLKNIGINI